MKEVVVIGVVSTLPLWLGILAAVMKGTAPEFALEQGVLRGQLLFYAMSFCGSIAWLSCLDRDTGTFPPRIWYVLFVIVCTALSFVVVGDDPILDQSKPVFINVLSVLFLLMAASLYWAVIVMRRMDPPSVEQTNREGVSALSAKFDALRREGDQ